MINILAHVILLCWSLWVQTQVLWSDFREKLTYMYMYMRSSTLVHRESLLEIRHAGIQGSLEKPDDQVFAISTFHPTYRDFRGVITDNWDLLAAASTKLLYESKVVYGNRRPKNLRDMLVSAWVKLEPQETGVSSPVKECKQCPRKNMCKYVPKLDLSGKIIGIHDKRSWRTRMNANCQSNNCIYAIECTRSGQHYVGQTSRHVGRRMYEHLTSILQENKDLSMGDHFSKRNQHEGWKDFKFFILEFCSTPADEAHIKDREAIERKWQFRLHCNYSGGMNREDALVKYWWLPQSR